MCTCVRAAFSAAAAVRWCPCCGDNATFAAVQRVTPDSNSTPDNTVFISGIGCSSRFPYYMNTYGFHTIHGRAPAVATGVKLANPELNVWVVTGDGDGLSIGGNHLMHVLRRNLNMQIMLFNNQIYGLTKGQYSPTTTVGKVTPSSPLGSVDQPITPARFALGAGARFVGRGFDVSKDLSDLLKQAHDFHGTGFVEILQNCPVFNDGIFEHIRDKKTGPAYQVWLEHGKPIVFGANRQMGVRLNATSLTAEVVALGDGVTEADLLVHDETNLAQAFLLADLPGAVALGVLYRSPGPVYDDSVQTQNEMAVQRFGAPDMAKELRKGHTWTVS
ncbi:MAG: 2-oxoacid:ferredoxin oxidoreductase subunit beta [Myxococcales bacterium]|nr:2-oxoacid:ferredoxin oxidoreductase subunit beta [Myxococcales bacterium]